MKWWFLLLMVAVIQKEIDVEGAVSKKHSRLSRSLSNKKNIYKLDHFIELVEKIERHPLITGKKPLGIIANYIRNFGYINQKWEKLLGKSDSLPVGILTADEETVLRGMMDHGFSGQQEKGVVNTPYGDVALGRVITGISAGIKRKKDIILPEISGLSSKPIDNLYAATVVGDIGQTALVNKIDPSKPLFGPGGTWLPNSECPEVFTSLTSKHSEATDAEILGGIDGFLMALNLPEWWSVSNVRLGQLLRMYYNDGVAYDKNYAACRRFDTFQEMVTKTDLINQATLFMYAVKIIWHDGMDFSGVQTSAIPKLAHTTSQKFLTYLNSINRRMPCPKSNEDGCSLPANLVFVMDESGSIGAHNYIVEKKFVKNITEAFDISPYETRVAVIEYSTSFEVSINLNEYSSKSRLMCAVEGLDYKGGSTHTTKAIKAAYDILKKSQSESDPLRFNDPKILVLLTDGKSNGGEKVLKPIVESVKKNLTGLTIVSVGIGNNYLRSELELIATDPNKHVFTANDFSKLVTLVKSIRSQTCKTSVILKPVIIEDQKKEEKDKASNVLGYVSPGKARFFTLPADTLFKTENISIQIKPTYGTVTLYTSRTNASPGPDNYDFKLEVGGTSVSRKKRSTGSQSGTPKYLQLYNLCKGYNETTCPPLYFAVVGKNSSQSCSDRDCSVPTQIKFEIKTEQIIPKKENVCYFELKANKIHEATNISVKISAVKDEISFYFSRANENPNLYINSYKTRRVDAGETKTFIIPTPCAEKDKASCASVYLYFRGAHLKCTCTGRNCSLPNQVTIDVNVDDRVEVELEPKVCYYQLSPEKQYGHRMIQIKISPINDTVAVYASRMNVNPDESNHTQKIPPIGVGQTRSLNFSTPCSGLHRNKCSPLYLTFIGRLLSCNCTGKSESKECTLPDQVSIIFTPGYPSAARPFKTTVCLISTTLVFSFFFK